MIYALRTELRRLALPFFDTPRPSAGFPSPAADFVENQLDLNDLIVHPAATFIVKIAGDSLDKAGIHSGDLAIVDRSLAPRSGRIVVVVLNGELLVKRLRMQRGEIWLDPDSDDPRYQPLQVTGNAGFEIWGVVKNTIRNHLG